jgi:molybdopterin molybdotransferase
MLKPSHAIKIILKHSRPMGIEKVDLSHTLGRVLAEDVASDIDIPAFDRSAMDGFAINSKDGSEVFEIIEDIPAGRVPKKKVKRGQSARIMTGAMLPRGADKVIKVEDTKLISNFKFLISNFENKSNVSKRGEDVRKGSIILKKGTKIRPQEAAMLASVGKPRVLITKKPKVTVISTGSELVEPSQKPGFSKIRNSNSSMLLVQLKRRDIEGKYLGIARDNFAATKKLVKKGLKESDILLLSGGVSVGDYDFVRDVLRSCGVKVHFNKVAIKPGKPTVFGTKGKKLVFGLPGNPVSVLVIFELFVVPAIDRIVGRKTKEKLWPMKLLKDFDRRDIKREQYYPVRITETGAIPLEFHGSAHIHALTQAEGIMQIKRGVKSLKKGTVVIVRPI